MLWGCIALFKTSDYRQASALPHTPQDEFPASVGPTRRAIRLHESSDCDWVVRSEKSGSLAMVARSIQNAFN